ncbi:Argonaute3, partial [Phytophthora megakarya]
PRIQDEWAGRAEVLAVNPDDPDLQQEFLICRRPGVAKGGKTAQMKVNYFGVSLDQAPPEIFKYHVDHEQRPERPLPHSLVRNVINAALRQYEEEFGGIRVVHDGMSAMYAPVTLPWTNNTFVDVNPDDSSPTPPPPPVAVGDAPRRPFRGPRTFVVKIKMAETISTTSLTDYYMYSNPDVNVMPVLQALDVVACHLGAQRMITVGRNFFSMKKTFALKGGKELCWGYHQAIRIADRKLLMNVDQAATVFYAPKELMKLVLPALNAQSPDNIRVVPTHRKDRKRAIFGISAQPANKTMVNIKGESMSIADYFSKRYNLNLRYPNLPLVNVGSKRPGKENWLLIELCEVAPGQRCANINDLDTAEIIRQTSQPPRARQETISDQVHQAGFENDPYLAAFGMKVEQRLETVEARVMDPPDVQYANVSEQPHGGQWNLRDKCFVKGATMRNWGVVISANVGERDVQGFIRNLVDMAGKSGMAIEDSNPRMIHQDRHRGAQVEELMKMCHTELKARNRSPPQLIMVIKQDKGVGSYSDIKRMSDTVLGIPSQCIVAQHIRNAKSQYCDNVCLEGLITDHRKNRSRHGQTRFFMKITRIGLEVLTRYQRGLTSSNRLPLLF